MTPDAATDLAKRIINTWHGGPKLPEWTDALAGLDQDAATTAFIRLRSSDEHAPSIARLTATARGIIRGRVTTEQDDDTCSTCDGTGWVECVDDRRHARHCKHRGTNPHDPGDCHCHAVVPCRCPTGTERADSWRQHS